MTVAEASLCWKPSLVNDHTMQLVGQIPQCVVGSLTNLGGLKRWGSKKVRKVRTPGSIDTTSRLTISIGMGAWLSLPFDGGGCDCGGGGIEMMR